MLPGSDQRYAPTEALDELPPITDETRAIVNRVTGRRNALMADQQNLRARYEEVMRWVNPPWDSVSRRLDPQPELAGPERLGRNVFHADLTHPTVDRWASLQLGEPPILRVIPKYVPAPVDDPNNANAQLWR
jgi:hypothetical protein